MEFRKILLEVSIEQLKRDWVGEGPHKISEELFELLCRLTNNKSAYTTWLVKKVGDGVVPSIPSVLEREFKDVFSIFDKHKQNFSKKDINQYKTTEDVLDFIKQAREIEKEESEKKEVSDFKIGSVKVNGKTYDVYRLPQGNLENKPIAIKLGRHNTGQRGWCVSYDGPSSWYATHINKENLYFIINPADRLRDKYCMQYGYYDARPFDLTDHPISFADAVAFYPVYQLISAKDEKPIPSFARVAVEAAEALKANTTLEDIKVADNLYKVNFKEPLSSWLKPMLQLAGILDVDSTHNLPEATVMEITEKLRGSLTSVESLDGIYYYRLNDIGTIAIPYVGSISLFTYSIQSSIFTRSFIGLQKILQEDDPRRIYFQLKEALSSVDLKLPDLLVYTFDRDSLPSSEDFYKGSEKKVSYYIVPQDTQLIRILMEVTGSDDEADMLGYVTYFKNQTIGIAKQKDNCIIFSKLYSEGDYPTIFRFVKGKRSSQESYNPDVLYEMYKSLKSYDNSIVYPTIIQKVHNIKEGELNQYRVNNIGHTKELFRVPVDQRSSIPYSVPRITNYTEYILLGYISKWQFVITNVGYWVLTGRWGSSGSPSWISSVPGLGETLEAICNHYQIPRPVGLREWRMKNPDAPRIDVPREEPANQDSEQTDDSNVPFRDLPIEERLQRAADAGLLQEETMHIADYTFRGRQGHVTLRESCLHGPWEDFRQSFFQSTGSTSTVRMAEQFVESNPGTQISEVYVWPVAGGSWNGIFVIRRGEQTVRVIRRMGEQGNFSYRTYRNGLDWTLTI